jgi:hypothetical protein
VVAAGIAVTQFVVREGVVAGAAGFPLDDSWIHLHFARNLAEGAGFSYNPGTPVAGSTAPLWTLVLAAGALVTGPGVAMAKALGLAATVGAALVLRRAALAWGASPAAALGGAVALVVSGPIAWGALSGMEVSLAALLVAGALLAHAGERALPAAVASALAVLARPEAVVLVPLLALAGPQRARRLTLFALMTAAALAPAVAFSLATVGAPVPATAAAKVEGGLVGWLAGVREPWSRALASRPWEFVTAWIAWLGSTHWLLPVVLGPAVAAAWWRTGSRLGLPALVLVVHPLAMALLAPYRDPGFQEGRYSMHLLPVALTVLAVALPRRPVWLERVLLVAWLAGAAVLLPGAAGRYAWGVQNINAMQVHLGQWVDRELPRHARLAVNDVGAIAYFSRRHVIDLMGLVTPEILPYRLQGAAGVVRYVRERCPDYVIVFPTWFPELTAQPGLLVPTYAVRLTRNLVAGGPEMVVYRLAGCGV